MRVIGIDPGSRICGVAIIDVEGQRQSCVVATPLRLVSNSRAGGEERPVADRLASLHRQIAELIEQYRPDVAAIEKVFMAKNPDSALKLGQARGVALAALSMGGLAVHEYSAREIKQAVVGRGAADKVQIQHMVSVLLKLDKQPQADAADALGVALCHVQHSQGLGAVMGSSRRSTARRGSGRSAWRNLQAPGS